MNGKAILSEENRKIFLVAFGTVLIFYIIWFVANSLIQGLIFRYITTSYSFSDFRATNSGGIVTPIGYKFLEWLVLFLSFFSTISGGIVLGLKLRKNTISWAIILGLSWAIFIFAINSLLFIKEIDFPKSTINQNTSSYQEFKNNQTKSFITNIYMVPINVLEDSLLIEAGLLATVFFLDSFKIQIEKNHTTLRVLVRLVRHLNNHFRYLGC